MHIDMHDIGGAGAGQVFPRWPWTGPRPRPTRGPGRRGPISGVMSDMANGARCIWSSVHFSVVSLILKNSSSLDIF